MPNEAFSQMFGWLVPTLSPLGHPSLGPDICSTCKELCWLMMVHAYFVVNAAGLGRVPDVRVRVQVWVLVLCMSTSTSMSIWLLHEYEYEYEYEYWLMSTSTSTSTGLWSTFYKLYKQQYCIFQSLKSESSDSNEPWTKLQLPIVHVNSLCQCICLIILCNLVQWHFNLRIVTYWLSWLTFTICCQVKNRKQKLCNIMKCVENSVFF